MIHLNNFFNQFICPIVLLLKDFGSSHVCSYQKRTLQNHNYKRNYINYDLHVTTASIYTMAI
jgi:hypothetical protein